MQLIKGLFIAAVICVASVSAEQQEIDSHPNPNGFSIRQVGFASNSPAEEVGEVPSAEKTDYTMFIVAGVAGCVCIGILGSVYLKRRKNSDKLQGDIFTIDDKNSVL
ncbi:unnamed protein product [Peronospora destructor]|uniref:Gram-positive cocci surface proteins LPxTG domain-containing protein n=1 Tax=Peronospora destructor TaxID=86335 RepID=A0AAV0V5D4_9STRA|nr:unnamed protein product [Peronospora destructor]